MIRTIPLRASRAARSNGPRIQRQIRFQSQNTAQASPGASGAVTGGLVGGGVALGVTYAWYHFSGAKSTIQTAKQAKGYVDKATSELKVKFEEKTPDTNEALQTLRNAANKYASFIPGGKQYVDAAFSDIETIRKHHADEADNIVREAYGELRDVSKKGVSWEAANEAYNVLSKHIQNLLELGKDALEDILENHPQVKEKLGGSAEQLKQLGERLGPEAKKEVDDTWQQINNLVQAGLTGDTVDRARQLIQEKTRKVRELGEHAFNKGLEQIQPMLNENPQIKEFVEKNMDTLKQGNITETISKLRNAVSSGSTQDLENYLNQIKQKAQDFSSTQLTGWLNMVPGGSQIIPQLQKLKEVADKHGSDAEELAKETVTEIKQVLDKKKDRLEQLAESGKQEVKQN